MTFHPRRFLWESGLHLAGRSLPVMTGGMLVFVGGAEGWSPGDEGVVRYDPREPARALWVGRREH